VGKYEVVNHIATGGMGAVYRAIDTDLKRDVALKILTPEVAAKPAALERFRREARHAARLRHDNIVTVYEFGSAGGTWFLALEFVEGIDLQEYINRKGRLDPEEARFITLQALQALDHAHRNSIIHRDIKPSNFLLARLDGKMVVKLSDFGLSRETNDLESRVTKDGTTVGTVDYIAPEQARDSGLADIRSDIYSLGCTLFHMLAGRPPFNEGGLGERLFGHIQVEPPDIQELNPRVSAPLAAVVRRMLAKNPDERYQTPGELLKELHQIESLAAISGRDLLASLALDSGEFVRKPESAEAKKQGRAGMKGKRTLTTVPGRHRNPADTVEQATARTETLSRMGDYGVWVLVAGAALLVFAVIVILLAFRPSRKPPPDQESISRASQVAFLDPSLARPLVRFAVHHR
jgi:serine/threonine-protein kinase